MAILYRHLRIDTNKPFYIGIGKDENRAYSKRFRNKYWHSIVKKSIYKVEILFFDLTWEEACVKEKEFIALYGRKDNGTGILCNMTDGGEGILGYKHSVKTIKKMSSKIFTEETRKKISQSLKNNKYALGFKHSENTKLKLSEYAKGNQINLGRKASKETKQKMSEAQKGSKSAKAKKVININTNQEYNCVKEMCLETGLKPSTMSLKLNGKVKNNTPWRYA